MVDPIHTMVSLTLPLSLQPPLMTQRLHLCLAVLLRHLLDHKALLRVPHFTPGGSTVTTRPPNISYHICSRRSRSQTIPVLQETQHNPPQEISQLGIPPSNREILCQGDLSKRAEERHGPLEFVQEPGEEWGEFD